MDATNFATEASFALAAEIWIMVGIAGQPKHGYAIMKDIQGLGGFSMRPGTLYAALARMERAQLVEEVQTRNYRRRPFRLTELGRARLAADLDTLARLASTGLQRLTRPHSESKGPPS